jgi:hypothetical protein
MEKDHLSRLKRASKLIDGMLHSPSSGMLRRAEDCGCLEEFEFLCEEARICLDDDDWLEEIAWEKANAKFCNKISA